jgi:hypothetical protein
VAYEEMRLAGKTSSHAAIFRRTRSERWLPGRSGDSRFLATRNFCGKCGQSVARSMTNNSPFRLSRLAVADLEDIWLYTRKNWSLRPLDARRIEVIRILRQSMDAQRHM